MKRRILSLLGGLIITIAASAQQPPGDSIGVYACLDEGIQKMSIIRYHDVVADNVLPSTFTIGLAEMKARYQFLGTTSPNRFRRQAHLRMYFRKLEEEGWVEGILFDPQYSVTDFHIARFDVKDGTRLLTGMTATIMRECMTCSSTASPESIVWYSPASKATGPASSTTSPFYNIYSPHILLANTISLT